MKGNKLKAIHETTPVIEALSCLLADSYVLYLKTQNCHWNVNGIQFYSLHQMFEKQYIELAGAVDKIAERIRALNTVTPASLTQFLQMTTLKEIIKPINTIKMLMELRDDHERLSAYTSEALIIAKKYEDEVTLDLLVERKAAHEKTAWMLRNSIPQT